MGLMDTIWVARCVSHDIDKRIMLRLVWINYMKWLYFINVILWELDDNYWFRLSVINIWIWSMKMNQWLRSKLGNIDVCIVVNKWMSLWSWKEWIVGLLWLMIWLWCCYILICHVELSNGVEIPKGKDELCDDYYFRLHTCV